MLCTLYRPTPEPHHRWAPVAAAVANRNTCGRFEYIILYYYIDATSARGRIGGGICIRYNIIRKYVCVLYIIYIYIIYYVPVQYTQGDSFIANRAISSTASQIAAPYGNVFVVWGDSLHNALTFSFQCAHWNCFCCEALKTLLVLLNELRLCSPQKALYCALARSIFKHGSFLLFIHCHLRNYFQI